MFIILDFYCGIFSPFIAIGDDADDAEDDDVNDYDDDDAGDGSYDEHLKEG